MVREEVARGLITSRGEDSALRILLVSDAYPPIIGGATRAAQQLGRQLASRGHQVHVATAWQRDLPAVEYDGQVEVHRLRGLVSRAEWISADETRYTPPPFPDPEMVWRLRRLIRRFKPDVVHSYGWLTYSVAVALRGSDVPLVLAAREYANVCPIRLLVRQGREKGAVCDGPEVKKCLDCAISFYGAPKGVVAVAGVLGGRRLLRRRIDGLHSTSSYTQRSMRRHLLHGRSGTCSTMPDKVIPDFREDHLTGPPDPEILAQLPTGPYLLFVGSFRRIKGDLILLDAYRRLTSPPPLVMIGARSADPLPDFPPGVVPLFNVPHDTVMAAWDRALLGVFPSVVPEALGNVVHEAMSRGKAVIGTRPGGHEDMIVEGETGLMVPSGDVEGLADAMRELLADPHLRESMGAAGLARSRAFTADEVVPEIEQLYREVRSISRA